MIPTPEPTLVIRDGTPWWALEGRLIPVYAGGDDGDGGSGEGGEGGEGGGDGGSGQGAGGAGGKGSGGGSGDGGGESEADRKLRAENIALRKRAKEAEAEAAKLRGASETELQAATRRAEEAEKRANAASARVREAELRTAVGRLARDLGVTDIGAAVRLIGSDVLEWDDDTDTPDAGTVKKALQAAVKAYPTLTAASRGSVDGGRQGGSPGSTSPMSDLIRRKAGRA